MVVNLWRLWGSWCPGANCGLTRMFSIKRSPGEVHTVPYSRASWSIRLLEMSKSAEGVQVSPSLVCPPPYRKAVRSVTATSIWNPFLQTPSSLIYGWGGSQKLVQLLLNKELYFNLQWWFRLDTPSEQIFPIKSPFQRLPEDISQ